VGKRATKQPGSSRGNVTKPKKEATWNEIPEGFHFQGSWGRLRKDLHQDKRLSAKSRFKGRGQAEGASLFPLTRAIIHFTEAVKTTEEEGGHKLRGEKNSLRYA